MWMQTVVKREVLAATASALAALSRALHRRLQVPAAVGGRTAGETQGPEAVRHDREALWALQSQGLPALTILVEGYSYAEIGEINNWSHTKVRGPR
jgi:hypothetical protein